MNTLPQIGCICFLLFTAQLAWSQSEIDLASIGSKTTASKTERGGVGGQLSNYRIEELSRRAKDPETTAKTANADRLEYSKIVAGDEQLDPSELERIRNTKAMPATNCKSVEVVRIDRNVFPHGAWRAHQITVAHFINQSGFGFWRLVLFKNQRGQQMGSPGVDRVELVGLLTSDEPSVYVLDEVATPSVAKIARRRPLDQFEQLALEAVRRGEELVATKEAPTRMFGAIRASESCLECHTGAHHNDLLGAFSYYLETPVDQLDNHPSRWLNPK